MLEWFLIFDYDGVCIYELLAYTADGALKDAVGRGVPGAFTARRLFQRTSTKED